MTDPDVNPLPSPPDLRTDLADAFAACRNSTLALFDGMADSAFREQIHTDYSPLGWHLGHVAYTEARWLVHLCGGQPLPRPELEQTFHVDGLPKAERGAIPDQDEVRGYARQVRQAMLDCLASVDLAAHERYWRFVLQHECQHAETISLLLACRDQGRDRPGNGVAPEAVSPDWLDVDAGLVTVGSDSASALDNERPAVQVDLPAFRIAQRPVTQSQFTGFLDDGGYRRPELWSDTGWTWRVAEGIQAPLYWTDGAGEAPVSGVSAHEADAFATWAGARLPTELEWEAAAEDQNATGFLGSVWQWTQSIFAPYPQFQAWPYESYSKAYFDGRHRVLRGGSAATRPWALRPSFRNWYLPETRQLIAGFRLASD
jgi:iron(II)-dependent oxidoreductase